MIRVVRADCFEWVKDNIGDSSVPLVVCDPPYGNILKHDWDRKWTIDAQINLTRMISRILVQGGTAYVWGGIGKPHNRIFFEWCSKVEELFPQLTLWDVITWSKKRAYGTKNRYLFTREECAMLVKGDKPKTFNVPLLDVKRGYPGFSEKYPALSEFKRRTNVWTDITELFKGKIHDAEKPSRLAEVMIETSSNEGDLVLDMFAGSGSTGVAAQKLHRKCILVERSDCEMHIKSDDDIPYRRRRSSSTVIVDPASLLQAASIK